MWYQIENILGPIFQLGQNLDRHDWISLFIVALIVGFFCMRGFGSRASY